MTIEQLLTRNLHEVFGEGDADRRRRVADEIFADDVVFHGPKGSIYRGREAIVEMAGIVRASHPTFAYAETGPARANADSGMVAWVSGPPGEPPRYAGVDFILVCEGRIAAIYLYLDGEG